MFDYLFRKHLQNVYLILGDAPPPELSRPISRRGQRAIHTLPRAFLDVKVDGRQTFFEWVAAGRYTCQNERGTMAMVTRGPMKDVYFGFNLNALLIRIDFDTPANVALADFDTLRVGFIEPQGWEVLLEIRNVDGRWQYPLKLVHQGNETSASDIQAGSSWRFRLPGSALRSTSRFSFTSSCWKAGRAATARPEKAPSISLVLRRILSKLCGTSNEGIERVFCQQPSELADAGIAKGSHCR